MRKILVIAILCALCVSAVMIGCANPVNSRQDTVDSRNKQSAINKSQSEIEALIKQLGSDDWQTRENAQMELEKIGLPAEAALKEVAQSPDLEIYNRASFILKVIAIKKRLNFPSDVVKEIPNLYHDLASLDADDRYGVFLQIAEKNEKGNYKYRDKITNQEIAKLVGDVLLEKGQELDSNQKLNIIGECLSLDAKEAIPEIMKLLNDKNGNVRSGSVYFLCQLGGKEVLPEIMKLINDDDRYVQMSVLDSIIKFDAKETIPKIVKLMRKENDSEIRAYAVSSLGQLGAKEAIPEIMKLMNDNNFSIYTSALRSLVQLGAKEAIPEIIRLLNDKDKNTRVVTLIRQPDAQMAIPDDERRLSLLGSLVHLGAKEAIPELIKLLNDRDLYFRGYVAISMIELGAKDKAPKELIEDIKRIARRGDKRAELALKELGVEVE